MVSYRCRALLGRCLASVAEHAPGAVLRVIDNDSRDGTVELIRSEFPQVDLVASDRNLGFAAATNIGIARGEAPYVLVLNPDTRLEPGTFDVLLELMERRPDVAVAGCRLEREDGSFDHAARRSFPTVLGALGHFLRIGRLVSSGPLAQYRAVDVDGGPVDAVNGAFMLIRRQALDRVGAFDEGYWMYMEDLDLCYRLREAGWTIWYEPSVGAVHVKGATAKRSASLRLVVAFHRGMARFYRKHYAADRPRVVNAVVLAGIAAKLAVAVTLVVPARIATHLQR